MADALEEAAITKTATTGTDEILVVEDGRTLGMLVPADVDRAVEVGNSRRDGDEPPDEKTRLRAAGPAVWVLLAVVFLLFLVR